MKKSFKKLLHLHSLFSGLGLILVVPVEAQTFMNLYTFTGGNDGAYPSAGLILSGNTLYGTAAAGGSNGYGAVFAFNIGSGVLTSLYSFTGGSDGSEPQADLVLSGNTLYGTTVVGGTNGQGAVFAVNTDGLNFTNLHSFAAGTFPFSYVTNSDGIQPEAGLVLSGNTLYGTATRGGSNGNGTVFSVNTDGAGFTNLHVFTAASGSYPYLTNSDGAVPFGGLILSGKTLYGTTGFGGRSGNGTIFAVNTDVSGFTNYYSFTATSGSDSTNGDGANPGYGSLTLAGNTLYGMAGYGGTNGNGAVFAFNIASGVFAPLYSFSATTGVVGPFGYGTNSDGADPQAGLILSGNTLYGTTQGGGSGSSGTLFAINTNGTGFTTIYDFTPTSGDIGPFQYGTNSDGADPQAGLILSGNTLYGTANGGGSPGDGTIFSLSFIPQLTIMPSGTNVILTWPTNMAGFDYSGFTLQSTTNLVSTNWRTNSPAPVVVNGQNTVSTPVLGTQRFYRLMQ